MSSLFDKLGGRKFVGFVLLAAAGLAIELTREGGISVNMAAFLVGVYTIYSASNAAITNKALGIEASMHDEVGGPPPAANNEEVLQQLASLKQQLEGSPVVAEQVKLVLEQISNAIQSLNAGQLRNEQALQVLQQATASVQKSLLKIA
jgi:hypothetical protein